MTVAARDWLHVRVVLHSGRSETASTIFPYSLSFPSWEPGRPASPPGAAHKRGASHVYRFWDHRSHCDHRANRHVPAEALTACLASVAEGICHWQYNPRIGRAL
jgi:hypothetical protein